MCACADRSPQELTGGLKVQDRAAILECGSGLHARTSRSTDKVHVSICLLRATLQTELCVRCILDE